MRLSLAALLALILASCTTDAGLCSDDPNCQPAGCGPSGCTGDVGGGRAGSGGTGGAGGSGGTGGIGGTGGAQPDLCTEMCQFVYQQCGQVLTGPGGRLLAYDECVATCAQGIPSRVQAECVLESACLFGPCLEPVPAAVCDMVCTKVYGTCGGTLIVDGSTVTEADCRTACPYGLTNAQASCIVNSACTDWVQCTP